MSIRLDKKNEEVRKRKDMGEGSTVNISVNGKEEKKSRNKLCGNLLNLTKNKR